MPFTRMVSAKSVLGHKLIQSNIVFDLKKKREENHVENDRGSTER